MPRAAHAVVGMSTTCVQLAGNRGEPISHLGWLSTCIQPWSRWGWKNTPFFPLTVHKFCTQFSAGFLAGLPEVARQFSPLSTGLIIRTVYKRKEFLVIRQGDKS